MRVEPPSSHAFIWQAGALSRMYLPMHGAKGDLSVNSLTYLKVITADSFSANASPPPTKSPICSSDTVFVSKALTGGVLQPLREEYLNQLLTGEIDVVTCATMLDQGIDIPDIDTAIIIASNQQKRQMIQRLGRVLRAKRDNRTARIVIAYAKDTWEDPARNGNRVAFIECAIQIDGRLDYLGG